MEASLETTIDICRGVLEVASNKSFALQHNVDNRRLAQCYVALQ
jgi:hypothetical protein